MFPIIAKIAEGTAIVFKNNDPVFIFDNTYEGINIYAEPYDCKCFLETLSLDPTEFNNKQTFEDNYIKLYQENEYTIYWMEA